MTLDERVESIRDSLLSMKRACQGHLKSIVIDKDLLEDIELWYTRRIDMALPLDLLSDERRVKWFGVEIIGRRREAKATNHDPQIVCCWSKP